MKIPALNTIQTIALTGVITSLCSQLGLSIAEKTVEGFWKLYPVWAGVFLIGSLIRIFYKGELDDHHHAHEGHAGHDHA